MASFSILIGSAANDPETVTASGSGVSVASSKEMQNIRKDIAPASLDQLLITVDGKDLSLYDPMELAGWAACLKEGATVAVKVSGDDSASTNADFLQPIHASFLLAGLKGASERREADGSRVLTATRSTTTATAAKPLPKTAVTISLDEDLIDEDGLLDNTDGLLAPPPAMSEAATATDDCGGRTACDNCTCGRADQEASEAKKDAPKSSCGKCGLGDAFRCASCPYLGMPAFKPGEEHLVLQLNDDL